MKTPSASATPLQTIQNHIHELRGQQVMFDFDLAKLYGVETKRLKEAVKRNIKCFPPDFMFSLNLNEFENLRSQFASSSWGGIRYAPFVFTEQGVAMLSSVLNSETAIEVNIAIMRAFVLMRRYALSHKELTVKLKQLEEKYDQQFNTVHEALTYLLQKDKPDPAPSKRKRIGFHAD
jgi:ORF6N domain.